MPSRHPRRAFRSARPTDCEWRGGPIPQEERSARARLGKPYRPSPHTPPTQARTKVHDAVSSLGLRARKAALHSGPGMILRSEEHTSELQSHVNLVCRLLLEKKKLFQYDVPQPERF